MADKLSTRVARSYTFTFESEEEKAQMLAHAKKGGRTLAGLIKYLLEQDAAKATPPPPAAAATAGA
jgi:hypothetical protein